MCGKINGIEKDEDNFSPSLSESFKQIRKFGPLLPVIKCG